MPKKKDYRPILALDIFEKALVNCDPLEQEFIEIHAVEFGVYQKAVAKLFRAALRRKMIRGREHAMIYSYFTHRIPANYVDSAIQRAEGLAEKRGEAILSPQYFGGHVWGMEKRYWKQYYVNLRETHRVNVQPGPWGYNLFRLIKMGKLKGFDYDPWWGASVRRGHGDHEAPVSEKEELKKEIAALENQIECDKRIIDRLKVKLAGYYDTYENNELRAAIKIRDFHTASLAELKERYERL